MTAMDVRKYVLEVTEENQLRGLENVKRIPDNRLTRRILVWEPQAKRWR